MFCTSHCVQHFYIDKSFYVRDTNRTVCVFIFNPFKATSKLINRTIVTNTKGEINRNVNKRKCRREPPNQDRHAVTLSNLPHNEENTDGQSQIISLIVKQVVDNSVVPFGQIFAVRLGEPVRAGVEVVPRSQRRQLHFGHFLRFRLLLSVESREPESRSQEQVSREATTISFKAPPTAGRTLTRLVSNST